MTPTRQPRRWIALLAAVLIAAAPASEALAAKSGGYGRPTVAARTPSLSAPSGSSGYRRPDAIPSSAAPARTPSVARASVDRQIAREGSYSSLQAFRAKQEAKEAAVRAAPAPSVQPVAVRPAPAPPPASWRTPSVASPPPTAPAVVYAPPPGWRPPAYARHAGQRYGSTDALTWWFLTDAAADAARTAMLAQAIARDPAGYREFRADADRLARENADLRRRLDEAQPLPSPVRTDPVRTEPVRAEAPVRTPRIVADAQNPFGNAGAPPGARTGATTAAEPARAKAARGWGWEWIVLALLLAAATGAALVFFRRRRAAAASDIRAESSASAPAGGSHRFRVGMSIPADPTPFLLAGDAIKSQAPDPGAGGASTVTSVGLLRIGGAEVHRLYCGPDAFYEVHLNANGDVDSVRWFSLFDEVTPSGDEWGAWLNPGEGMLFCGQFETQDGLRYARAWGSPDGDLPPRRAEETLAGDAVPSCRHTAMLYQRDTGLAAPAPATEWLLVDVVEAAAQQRASVRLSAGIVINPTVLGL